MTIVVNDLVARFRADTSEAERGLQQTQQQLQGVAQEARATGEQLDQLARKVAQSQGGPSDQWRKILDTQRLSASQVDEALGRTAQSTQRVVAATQQIVQPTQAAAKAAADMHDGFRMSETSLVRFGAALAGVSLGISVVAGAGRLLHDAVAGVVDRQLQWERSLVNVRALYGDLAPRITALSQQQAALPGVISTPQEQLEANIGAGYLTQRYGLSPTLAGRLTTQAARLGGMLVMDEQQRRALQGSFAQYAETGTGDEALRGLLGPLDPTDVAQQLGLRTPAALAGLAPQDLVEVRAQILTLRSAQALLQGNQEKRAPLEFQRNLQRTLAQSQASVTQNLEGGDLRLRIAAGALVEGKPASQVIDEQQQDYAASLKKAQEALDANTGAIADNQQQIEEMTEALRKRNVDPGAAVRALNFFGTLQDIYSVTSYDQVAQGQAAIAARLGSAIPLIGKPAVELANQASSQAYQDALQNMISRQAQRQPLDQTQERLEQQANQIGPGLERSREDARRALVEARAAEPVQQRMAESRQQAAQVEFALAERQADLETITLRQRERTLQMLRETVDLRRLDVQQTIVGVNANQAVLRAQQAALPSQNVLADAQYQTTRAGVLAQARMARLLQGKDVSGLPSFDELIRQNIEGQFATAEAGPAALEAGRGIQLAQRPATAAGLAQQLTAGQTQLSELAVDLANLGDLPQQVALEVELNQINRDQLTVQKELRDATKELVRIMGGSTGGVTSTQVEEIVGRALGQTSGGIPASDQLTGARR